MSQDNIKLQIDVAVLCQEISKVETMCDKYNIVEKDKLKQIDARKLAELMKIEGSDGGNCTFSSFHKEEEKSSGDEEDKSSGDEDVEPNAVPNAPVPPAVPVKRETAEEQLDWLTISDRDI